MYSSTASLIVLGIAIFSSIHRQPGFTPISRQFEWMSGLISFSLSSSFQMTQSRTCFNMAWLYLYLQFDTFPLNLRNLWWLFELVPNMGFIGSNCSDCSHYLMSDFCSAFAANLLMECNLFICSLFSAMCDFKFWGGICDAIDIFKWGLKIFLWVANWGATGSRVL